MVHIENIPEDDLDPAQRLNGLLGPAQVDCFIRQALQFCWMALPQDRKNVEELECQFRRIVERALSDFREDNTAFGQAK